MRTADNQIGFNVEKLTPYGWCVCGFGKPHDTREQAIAAMDALKAEAPGVEWRVMPALEGKS